MSDDNAFNRLHQSSMFPVIWFIGVVIVLVDFFLRLLNRSLSNYTAFLLWLVFAMLAGFAGFKYIQNGEMTGFFLSHISRLLLAVFLPVFFILFQEKLFFLLSDFIPSVAAALSVNFLFYLMLFIYFLGYPSYLFFQGMETHNAFVRVSSQLITFFIIGFVIFYAASVLFSTLSLDDINSTAAYNVPSFSDLVNDFRNWSKEKVWDPVVSGFNTKKELVTQPYYSGKVDKASQDLGVKIMPAKSLLKYYDVIFENNKIVPPDPSQKVVWTGFIESKSFADTMIINVSCVFKPLSSSNKPISHPAKPPVIPVRSAGGFSTVSDYTCEFPLSDVVDGENLLPGRFYTAVTFDFETWGYATVTFIDSKLDNEARKNHVDPAALLGIPSTIQAYYNAGPVALGMFDKITQPIPVDISNIKYNFLPFFGVTIQNAWLGSTGKIINVDSLIFQVPDAFSLDTDNCAGLIPSSKPDIVATGNYRSEPIRPGFTWYVWENINYSSDAYAYQTVRCPMHPKNDDWTNLLGGDLSPRVFTFVARANYTYHLESPVFINLRRVSK